MKANNESCVIVILCRKWFEIFLQVFHSPNVKITVILRSQFQTDERNVVFTVTDEIQAKNHFPHLRKPN
jgi:hypothetical protein